MKFKNLVIIPSIPEHGGLVGVEEGPTLGKSEQGVGEIGKGKE